ncbi:hypothetical protein ARAM_004494 [Aspergillus rambellii]|uniref:Uncharacterized protein n=1 Tax=Aspergillus rambellii TaxID=308745 RepID=A0A0F8UCD3_9EURO|nr:hypothetical protein ARAM_004494 [Aspergillus rambellii]
MAPEDPDVAASIRADQFTIQRPSSSLSSSALYHNIKLEHMNVSKVVSRAIVDVCETDDTGWYRPDADTGPSSAAGSPGLSSPASASKGDNNEIEGGDGVARKDKIMEFRYKDCRLDGVQV